MNNHEIENIEKYIHDFYGFGNWEKSSIWYIGIEEKGGGSIEDVKNRITNWAGENTDLIDNEKHQRNIGNSYLYTKGTLQKTWRPLIRLGQGYKGKSIDKESVREIQRNNWGHIDSDNSLLELLPLPSPNNDIWKYNDWSNIDYLQSRDKYENYIASRRIKYIKAKVKSYAPKLVVFYTTKKKYHKYWEQLIDEKRNHKLISGYETQFIKKDGTCFAQVPHPNGVRKVPSTMKFWQDIGNTIANTCI